MTPKERQQALDSVTPEELAKVKAHQASTEGGQPVDQEWMLLGEFAKAYGWQAYLDVKNDLVSLEEMLTLIEVSRKLDAITHYKNAEATLIGAGSAQAKKPAATFKSLTKDIIKQTRVKE